MQLSTALTEIDGINQASLVMATEANIALLSESGLIKSGIVPRPNDIVLAVDADTDDAHTAAAEEAERMLHAAPLASSGDGGIAETEPRSIEMGLAAMPQANLALISCPGEYAGAEAMKALRLGLDVMIFSDNVDVETEKELKGFAENEGRLVMGPDCGTAIIGGVPLGFANMVARGDIGIVAASGTGLQQVACLIDQHGAGVSHALGTGGRDLSGAIGGVSMRHGLSLLAEDEGTNVIVLISKPPAPDVADGIIAIAENLNKPVIINFVGANMSVQKSDNVHFAVTLEDAAALAVTLSTGNELPASTAITTTDAFNFAEGQQYIRGLYSGGTFSYEALHLLAESIGNVYSTTPLSPDLALDDAWQSRGHTVIDLGDDEFTRGRPHPMIDHRLRNDRFIKEAEDPETAVLLFDVVLGHGAHDDPAGEMIPALVTAKAHAEKEGRTLALVGFVCGTNADPQNMGQQIIALEEAGVLLTPSNAAAVRLASSIATGRV